MIHLPTLIQDLAIILIAAGFVTILFRKIGQPVVLGYIIAGVLVSSHVWFIPTVSDLPNIQIWADIGVIFLLFALGLEFSFKKLARVGGPASVTAIIEVMSMIVFGYVSGRIFGWNMLDSLFMGGILAISSTTIIIKTIQETGMKGRGFVEFVFGILIVEDLVAVLLLVLLSTVAVTKQFNGEELIYSALKLAFFVALCFLGGIFIIPTILKSIHKILNEEMLLVVALGLCFLTVIASTMAGFSPALGAFIMGSILAETNEVKKIEHLILPVKNLFGAIFFVSVGILINPKVLLEHAGTILILTLVTILGKFLSIMLGALLSRRSIRHSVQAALSLAQIGEFSFIIAALGTNLKVTSTFLYPIAVGISVITTFTTPYLIRNIDPLFVWISRCLPDRAPAIKNKPLHPNTNQEEKEKRKKNIYTSLALIFINAVITTSIFYFLIWILPDKMRLPGLPLIIILTAPFLWAILLKKTTPWSFNKKDRIAFALLVAGKLLVIISLLTHFSTYYSHNLLVITLAQILVLVMLFLFTPILKKVYDVFEKHFIKNFSEKEIASEAPSFGPWDAHISYLNIPAESEVAGRTLHELKIRETYGASIALIERGHLFITAPGRDEKLFPNDRVAVIGNDESIQNLTHFLKSTKVFTPNTKVENYALHKILVKDYMPFANKTIRKSGLREMTDGLVVGIERHGEKILNPDSMLKIQPDDLLWIVGDTQKIENIS
ncbi:MAG: cation:proton antiporter [Bacteriovorax sp.]|jgi:CPA2 family monovalent cation:H+ antiporter-2